MVDPIRPQQKNDLTFRPAAYMIPLSDPQPSPPIGIQFGTYDFRQSSGPNPTQERGGGGDSKPEFASHFFSCVSNIVDSLAAEEEARLRDGAGKLSDQTTPQGTHGALNESWSSTHVLPTEGKAWERLPLRDRVRYSLLIHST